MHGGTAGCSRTGRPGSAAGSEPAGPPTKVGAEIRGRTPAGAAADAVGRPPPRPERPMTQLTLQRRRRAWFLQGTDRAARLATRHGMYHGEVQVGTQSWSIEVTDRRWSGVVARAGNRPVVRLYPRHSHVPGPGGPVGWARHWHSPATTHASTSTVGMAAGPGTDRGHRRLGRTRTGRADRGLRPTHPPAPPDGADDGGGRRHRPRPDQLAERILRGPDASSPGTGDARMASPTKPWLHGRR